MLNISFAVCIWLSNVSILKLKARRFAQRHMWQNQETRTVALLAPVLPASHDCSLIRENILLYKWASLFYFINPNNLWFLYAGENCILDELFNHLAIAWKSISITPHILVFEKQNVLIYFFLKMYLKTCSNLDLQSLFELFLLLTGS